MNSIFLDHRHSEVQVVDRRCIEHRELKNWSLAYSGKASFVQKSIDNCLADPDESFPATALRTLIIHFAKVGGVFH
jgi:hypothetical protein